MQVVLRQDVDSLGLRGEVVNVARGYARNFLLPRGLAEVATPGLVAELARREEALVRHQARDVGEAQAIVARLEGTELRFEVKAGPTGSLFGSVTATTVADRLWETQKLRIDRRKLELAPIKHIGRYTAPIEVFAGVTADLRLLVVPEGGELPPEEEPEAEVSVSATESTPETDPGEAAAAAEASDTGEAAEADPGPEAYEASEPAAPAEPEPTNDA